MYQHQLLMMELVHLIVVFILIQLQRQLVHLMLDDNHPMLKKHQHKILKIHLYHDQHINIIQNYLQVNQLKLNNLIINNEPFDDNYVVRHLINMKIFQIIKVV